MNSAGLSDLELQKRAFIQYCNYLVNQKVCKKVKMVRRGKVPIDHEIERVNAKIGDLEIRIRQLYDNTR